MNDTIIERIRYILKKEEYTQQQFSEEANLSLNTIKSVLIRGSNPSSDFLIKVLTVFPKYSANWILTGEGNKTITGFDKYADYHNSLVELQKVDKSKEHEIVALIMLDKKYYSAFTLTEFKKISKDIIDSVS